MAGAADKRYDIFLSYARTPDAEAAATLKQALEAAGLSVWMDNEGIHDHEPITSRVVGRCGTRVCCWPIIPRPTPPAATASGN